MKNRLIPAFVLAIGLLLIPQISFADPNFDGLVPVLITGLVIFLSLIIVTIVFTIKYFKTGSKSSFFIALTPACIIYLLSLYLQHNDGYSLWQSIPLIITGLLFYKRVKDKSESIWPYAILNWTINSLMVIVVFSNRIFGDNGEIIFQLSRGLGILCYSFFSFLLTKTLLQSENKIEIPGIYIKVNLFLLASFIVGSIFSLLNFSQVSDFGINLWLNLPHIFKSIIPIAIACNITAFITIKYFPEKRIEEEDDLLL